MVPLPVAEKWLVLSGASPRSRQAIHDRDPIAGTDGTLAAPNGPVDQDVVAAHLIGFGWISRRTEVASVLPPKSVRQITLRPSSTIEAAPFWVVTPVAINPVGMVSVIRT